MSATGERKSQISAFQFFQVARYVSLLAASILITKSHLGQSFIGQYETYLLIASTLSFFWINGILTSYLRIYHASNNKPAVVFNTFLLLMLIAVLISVLLLICRTEVNSFFKISEERNSYYLFILFFFLNSISFFTEYHLLSKNQNRQLIVFGVVHLIIQTILIAAPVYLNTNYTDIIIGLTIFTGLKFSYLVFILIQNGSFKIDKQIFSSYRKTTPPLVISYFLGGISIYVDGIIVTHYFDKATFAMYQYGAREFPLSLLLANAFSAAVIQLVAADKKQGLQTVRSGSEKMMHILFPICILLIICSKWLYPAVFNPQFAESYIYFNIYILLLIPRLIFPQSILMALSETRIIMFSSCMEFILNIVLSLIFLRFFGLPGIAYATVIAFITDKTILAIYLKRRKQINIGDYTPIKTYFSYSFILILAFIVVFMMN